MFHLDEAQKQAKEATGLRDEKTGSEWTLGQTGLGPGSVLAAGAVAAGVVGAVATMAS